MFVDTSIWGMKSQWKRKNNSNKADTRESWFWFGTACQIIVIVNRLIHIIKINLKLEKLDNIHIIN